MPDNLRLVGVTGTRQGLTPAQAERGTKLLSGILQWTASTPEIHHGDCQGADAEMHDIAKALGYRTVSHPPTIGRYRAYRVADETWPPRAYLVRNDDIVNCTNILLAFPKESEESRFGGTWHTVRYARKLGKRVVIVWPDGTESL